MSTDPERLVVFDGFCHLCSGWARFLKRHPVDPPFRLVALQSQEGRRLLTSRGIDCDDPTTFLVLDRGTAFTESDAMLRILATLGGPWRLLRVARWVPRPIRNALYRTVARNRYRWFGRRAACYLPDSQGA